LRATNFPHIDVTQERILIQIKKSFQCLLPSDTTYGFGRKAQVRSDLMLRNALFYGWVPANEIKVLFFCRLAIGCQNSTLMSNESVL
jgi:hypothetical protein